MVQSWLRLVAFYLLVSSVVFIGTPVAAEPLVELVAGTSDPKGSILADAADRFAELVDQKSGGEIRVRVFYQSLGVEQQLAQSVQAGSVDIGQLSNGNSGRFSNAFLVYDLPFLFNRYADMLASLDGPIGRKQVIQFEKDLGVKVLFPISVGSGRDIQTRSKQLKTPADIKGMKIRTVSTPVDIATFKAWGGNPTPVDYAQTFSALQQGVVEGTQFSFGALPDLKFDEVLKHDIRLDYQALFNIFYMNARKLTSLSPRHQQIVLAAAEEAKTWNHQQAANRAKQAEKILSERGWQVYTPTPQELAMWTSIKDAVWEEIARQQKGKFDLDVARQLSKSQ